jgi:chromosome segregation ATPase
MENQTLHPLYRHNSPSQAAQTVSPQQPLHASNRDETSLLRAALAKACAQAQHWKRETEKMDEIARDALRKLDARKRSKQALKADYESARNDSETWRRRYKEIAAAHHEAVATNAYSNSDGCNCKGCREARDLQRRLDKANEKIEEYRERLLEAERERPEVEQRLQVGGAAFRKLKSLEPTTERLEAQVKALEVENKALQHKLREAEEGHARLKKTLESAKIEVVSRMAELEQETSSSHEKLRAAAQDALEKTGKLQACTEMLVRAEKVLKTCSQLHASKGESQVLTDALNETISNVAQFLHSLKA